MLLKDLQVGKRFMFDDRKTPLAFATIRGQYPSEGIFELVRYGENACPVLKHQGNGREITVVANTGYRYVLIIL